MRNKISYFDTKTVEQARLEYVSVAHPDTLRGQAIVHDRALLSLDVFFDNLRLIGNMVVGSSGF